MPARLCIFFMKMWAFLKMKTSLEREKFYFLSGWNGLSLRKESKALFISGQFITQRG